MSENLWDGYNTDDDEPTAGDLRSLVKKLQKQLKAKDDELAERDSKIGELTKTVKATSLRDLLTDAKIDPKFARLAERDGVEPTAEAVKAWVDENKDFYSFTPPAGAEAQPSAADEVDEGQESEDEVDPELTEAIAQGQSLEANGRPSGSSTVVTALEQAQANLGQFKTEAELDEFLRSLGAPRRVDLE